MMKQRLIIAALITVFGFCSSLNPVYSQNLSILCPDDVWLDCPADTDPDTTGWAIASGGTPPLDVIYEDSVTDGCGETYSIVRIFTVTDADENSESCDQAITLQDFMVPDVTVPEDVELWDPPNTNPETTGMATGDDNCGEVSISFEDEIEEDGDTTTITRTWTIEDECDNMVVHEQIIIVHWTACIDLDEDGYGFPASPDCTYPDADCLDDPSGDPVICDTCECGVIECAPCARCINPAGMEFPDDGIDSNCNGQAYHAVANSIAASHGRSSLIGSGIFNEMVFLLLPVGVILVMRIVFRKR